MLLRPRKSSDATCTHVPAKLGCQKKPGSEGKRRAIFVKRRCCRPRAGGEIGCQKREKHANVIASGESYFFFGLLYFLSFLLTPHGIQPYPPYELPWAASYDRSIISRACMIYSHKYPMCRKHIFTNPKSKEFDQQYTIHAHINQVISIYIQSHID